jgi:predicted Fe-Mo cluster-binding NifX family protein
MKIGIVTDDKKTISPHFGMARFFLVYEIQDGVVLKKEERNKFFHAQHRDHHGEATPESSVHENMLSAVKDCEAIIARGMGMGMYESINQLGKKPFITSIALVDDAARAYIEGTLDNHVERLH